jgi:hypothetical protein
MEGFRQVLMNMVFVVLMATSLSMTHKESKPSSSAWVAAIIYQHS